MRLVLFMCIVILVKQATACFAAQESRLFPFGLQEGEIIAAHVNLHRDDRGIGRSHYLLWTGQAMLVRLKQGRISDTLFIKDSLFIADSSYLIELSQELDVLYCDARRLKDFQPLGYDELYPCSFDSTCGHVHYLTHDSTVSFSYEGVQREVAFPFRANSDYVAAYGYDRDLRINAVRRFSFKDRKFLVVTFAGGEIEDPNYEWRRTQPAKKCIICGYKDVTIHHGVSFDVILELP